MKNKPNSPGPQAEVWGGAVLGVAEGLAAHGIPWQSVLELLGEAGIGLPRAEAWVPLAANLAFHAAVERAHGRPALRVMGRAIPDTARFAPDMDTLDRALRVLEVAYQVNHRGKGLGGYYCTFERPEHAEVVCENPYPCDMDWGILERLAEQYGGSGAMVSHRPGADCRRLGAKACVFDLRW